MLTVIMLTSYQASPGAYITEDGELYCLDCAERQAGGEDAPRTDADTMFIRFRGILDPKKTGLSPVIGYSLDEQQAQDAEDYEWDKDDGLDHSECEPALFADGCGHELREEYHYGHEDIGPSNPPVPRWVPCSSCHAGDGEPHRDGCPKLRAEA